MAAVTEEASKLSPGMQISKGVSLLEPLGAGGMGAVWLADHHGLRTKVVVKFMLGELGSSENARTRFSREAAAAAQVKSPHVVQMLDHGVSDHGVPFIVMEHLEGHDLGSEIEKGGAVEPGKVVAIVSQVAKALMKVHAAGLLHRDIKPDNIFLVDGEEDVFAKLLDFGIAKSASLDAESSLDGQTKTGQVVGTPFYMSPEQMTAQKTIDHRSDLWALGVVAFEALTGQRPFDGPSFGALAVKIATGVPLKPTETNPALPVSVDAWFARACAREPTARFASAKEMADAFRAAFDGVFSLPMASGDSGQRSTSGSGERSASGSRSGPTEVALAATALDDAQRQRAAVSTLGRSEAGIALAKTTPSTRGSPLLIIGGAVAFAAVVGGVFLGFRHPESASPATGAALPARSAPPMAPARVTTAPLPEVQSAVAPPATSAAPSASASAPSLPAAHPHAPAHLTKPPAGKPSAAPSATAKPAGTDADLY
jgi:serine/threonine-protein kinase